MLGSETDSFTLAPPVQQLGLTAAALMKILFLVKSAVLYW
jgi:hypothetical protein